MGSSQEFIDRVCEYRELPKIEVGQPCLVNGEKGFIIDGNSSSNFQVRFDTVDQVEYNCHPYFKMIIMSKDLNEVIFDSEEKI